MLTHHVCGIHKQTGRIQCVSSLLRCRCCMGSLASPNKLQAIQGNKIDIYNVRPTHMHHDGKVIVIKDSLIRHNTFASSNFFIWGSNNIHPKRKTFPHCIQNQGSQHTGTSAGTVPAGMSHTPQGVILCQERHPFLLFSIDHPSKCRIQPCKGVFCFNTMLTQQLHYGTGTLVLFRANLRVLGHPII